MSKYAPITKKLLCTYHCIGRGDSICLDKPISECMPRNEKGSQFNRGGIYHFFCQVSPLRILALDNDIVSTMQLPLVQCHCLFDFVGPVKIGSILSLVFAIICDCCVFHLCAVQARAWLFIRESEKVVPAQKYPRDTVDFEEQDIATRYFDIGTQS